METAMRNTCHFAFVITALQARALPRSGLPLRPLEIWFKKCGTNAVDGEPIRDKLDSRKTASSNQSSFIFHSSPTTKTNEQTDIPHS